MTPLVELANAKIGYPAGPPLFSCGSLTADRGRLICLLGSNGSGKSTLLRTLSGLLPPQEGAVRLEGAEVASIPVGLRARHLAALFASSSLSPVVSVHDLVALGRYPHTGRRGRLSAEDRRIVEEELERLDLAPLGHRLLGRLSDGERRRAHIARGLAQRTPLLILDEALSFLDALWRRRVLAELEGRCREGLTVVLATHDISEALAAADALWVIDGEAGSLEVGGPEDLALSGALGRVFGPGPYRFDPETNRFVAEAPVAFSFTVSGPKPLLEGAVGTWTRRGLMRGGGREQREPGEPELSVTIVAEKNGHGWHYRRRGDSPQEGRVASIGELVEVARRLGSGR